MPKVKTPVPSSAIKTLDAPVVVLPCPAGTENGAPEDSTGLADAPIADCVSVSGAPVIGDVRAVAGGLFTASSDDDVQLASNTATTAKPTTAPQIREYMLMVTSPLILRLSPVPTLP